MKRANKETDDLLLGFLDEVLRDTRKHLNKHGVIDKKLRTPRFTLFGYIDTFSQEMGIQGYILAKLDHIGCIQPSKRLTTLLADKYVTTGKYEMLVCCAPKPSYQGVSTSDWVYAYLRNRKLRLMASLLKEE